MDIASLLLNAHPEVMEKCQHCDSNGQVFEDYFDGIDSRPFPVPCQGCNALGYILKKDVAIKTNMNIIKSVTNLFKGVKK